MQLVRSLATDVSDNVVKTEEQEDKIQIMKSPPHVPKFASQRPQKTIIQIAPALKKDNDLLTKAMKLEEDLSKAHKDHAETGKPNLSNIKN